MRDGGPTRGSEPFAAEAAHLGISGLKCSSGELDHVAYS